MMTRRFHARFANGVLVPSERIELPADTELTITVDEPVSQPAGKIPRYDDPNDPMPEGGVAMIEWWSRHRIQIDPDSAQRLAESPEYLNQDSEDES